VAVYFGSSQRSAAFCRLQFSKQEALLKNLLNSIGEGAFRAEAASMLCWQP
jgi:hypothetical protein